MKKFRFSALLAFVLSIVAFVLSLLIVIAGKQPGYLQDEYMIKLNASHVGQNIIRFEKATSTSSATPSATTSSSSNPLAPLNPFSTSSPLNPNNPDNPLNSLPNSLEPILGNLTDTIDNGLGDAINKVTEGIVKAAGLKDFYYLYITKICQGNLANGSAGNDDGVAVDKCASYDDASAGLHAILPHIQSSVVIGQTNISVPLIAQLTHSVSTLTTSAGIVRRALIAFLIISLIGSGVSMLIALPSIFFPNSRLLTYVNLFFANLGAFAAFISAILLTALIKGVTSTIGGLGDAVSLFIKEGGEAIAFAWVSWACMFVVGTYWFAVWFVEVRRWGFVRRGRTGDEVGNWRGIRGEVWRDLKGDKIV